MGARERAAARMTCERANYGGISSMNFDLSDEQRTIRDTLRQFAEREIKPNSAKWDKEEIFPREVIGHLGELGFLGISFPERFGGGAADTLSAGAGGRGTLPLRRVGRADLRGAHVALKRAHQSVRRRGASRALSARHGRGEKARRMVSHRTGLRAPMRPRCRPARCARATTSSSTAPRCSSPTARSAMFTS